MSIPAPVHAVVTAINEADIDAFVNAFTPDGYVDDWGRVLHGPEGVRSWGLSDAIGAGAQMRVVEFQTEGDVTEIEFEWTSRVFNGTSRARVTTRGDLVSAFVIPRHS